MSAKKRKSTPKYGLKEKVAAYAIGLTSIVPMPSNAAVTQDNKIPDQAHVKAVPDTEKHTVVTASYKNELQEDQTQQSSIISMESGIPAKNTQTHVEVQAQPEEQAQPEAPVAQGNDAVWDNLAKCESGGNWQINTGNGYYGGIQFTQSSWNGVGGEGLPSQASREEQIIRGKMLQERGGWGNWPACSAHLGLQ
jgi:hypothetical protein